MKSYISSIFPTGIVITLMMILVVLCAFAQSPISILPNTDIIDVPHKYLLQDTSMELGLEDVLKHPDFKKLTGRLSVPDGATYWLNFSIKNETDTDFSRILHFDSQDFFEIRLYQLSQENKIIQADTTGTFFPFDYRPIKSMGFKFPINLRANETRNIYLYLDRRFQPIRADFRLLTPRKSLENEYKNRVESGIPLGISFVYLFFSIVLLLFFRKKIQFFFFIYVLGNVVYIFYIQGYGFSHLWSNYPFNYFEDCSPYVASTCILLGFTGIFQNFFPIKNYFPKVYTYFNIIIIISTFLIIGFIFWYPFCQVLPSIYKVLFMVEGILFILVLGTSLILGTIIYRKTQNIEYFWFLTVFIFVMVLALILLSTELKLFAPIPFISTQLPSIAILYETIVLSVLLIRKIYTDKIEQYQAILKERELVAMDLHSGVISEISGVKSLIEFSLKKDKPNIFKKINTTLDEAIEDVRDMIWLSRNEYKLLNNLNAKIRQKISTRFEHTPTQIHLDIPETASPVVLPYAVRRHLYFFIKEVVNNAEKYAQAQNFWAKLHYQDNQIIIAIKDDGKGFNMNVERKQIESGGHGLLELKNRATHMNAQYEIQSSLGNGTQIKLTIPIIEKVEVIV